MIFHNRCLRWYRDNKSAIKLGGRGKKGEGKRTGKTKADLIRELAAPDLPEELFGEIGMDSPYSSEDGSADAEDGTPTQTDEV